MRSLITAVRTLTCLPVPGRDADRFADALPWFPWVGFGLGAALWLAAALALVVCSGGWPMGAAIVVVAGGAALTRALHLDGLADWADSFGAGGDRQRALAIMKDPSTGAFGVTAVVVLLLAKFAALTRLAEADLLVWLVPAMVVGRTVAADLASALPYARAEGGTGAPFVDGAGARQRIAAWTGCLALTFAVGGAAGLAATAAGMAVAGWLAWRWRRRFGGITGDLLGASIEIGECAVLCVAALAADWLVPGIWFV